MKWIVVAAALLACGQAAPADGPDDAVPISQVIAQAQKNITELANNIRTQLNIPDQETVINAIKDQSGNLVTNVQKYIEMVSKEAKEKTPEFQQLWTNVKEKLDKVVQDINSNIPNAKESADQLQKQFQQAVETIVKESSTIADAVKENSGNVKTEFNSLSKKAIDIALKASQGLSSQLEKVSASLSAPASK